MWVLQYMYCCNKAAHPNEQRMRCFVKCISGNELPVFHKLWGVSWNCSHILSSTPKWPFLAYKWVGRTNPRQITKYRPRWHAICSNKPIQTHEKPSSHIWAFCAWHSDPPLGDPWMPGGSLEKKITPDSPPTYWKSDFGECLNPPPATPYPLPSRGFPLPLQLGYSLVTELAISLSCAGTLK